MKRSNQLELYGLLIALFACIAAYLALIPEEQRKSFSPTSIFIALKNKYSFFPNLTATITTTPLGTSDPYGIYRIIDPRELDTYTSDHIGERVRIKGWVVSISEDYLQMFTLELHDDKWDSIFFNISYDGIALPSGIGNSAQIEVFGEVIGRAIFQNLYGATISQPTIKSEIIITILPAPTPTPHPTATSTPDPRIFYISIDTVDLNEKTDKYSGKKVRVEGTIFNIGDGFFQIYTLENIPVYIFYEKQSMSFKLYENDNVIIYGIVAGRVERINAYNQPFTQPGIYSNSIEKK